MEQKSFGETIRLKREQTGLLLREVAACLAIDTALISKIERGERKAQKEQVLKLAELLKINQEELMVVWLADKILNMLEGEPLAQKALKSTEIRLKRH